MDKESIKNLGTPKLANIIIELYSYAQTNYAFYRDIETDYKKENKYKEAAEASADGHSFGYITRELETAIRFEIAKLKPLQSVPRPALVFLKNRYGIKNKNQFLSMPRKDLINLALECKGYEMVHRPAYDNRLNVNDPAILVYTYLNIQFELGLDELRKLKRKKRPRTISIDTSTLYNLSAESLAGIIVDLYKNCVRIHDFHSKDRQEYLENNNIRQYDFENAFCRSFCGSYDYICKLINKEMAR